MPALAWFSYVPFNRAYANHTSNFPWCFVVNTYKVQFFSYVIYCYYFSKKLIGISLTKCSFCQVYDNETFQLLLQDMSILLLPLLI